MKAFAKKMRMIYHLSAIPLNTERFKTIRINNLELKDSLAFLDGSLEKLVQTLRKSDHSFPLLKQVVTKESRRKLLLRKGVYPYSFIRGFQQIFDQKTLPPKSEFYSELGESHISDEEYLHAQNVWEEFNCKCLTDYTRVYCLSDTLLLAEVFQTFRRKIFSEFNLDASHYLSLPSLSKGEQFF